MNKLEKKIILVVLMIMASAVILDVANDLQEGVKWAHLSLEIFVAVLALLGIFFLLRDSFHLKRELQLHQSNLAELKLQAEKWRSDSRKLTEGLSAAIDQQLEKWKLSSAEKDITFLLLKGMEFKEIAEVRHTSERTVRTQAMNIYAKSGLKGRTELSAFFLEDLLPPNVRQT